jgi:phage-related minor tail protein
MTVEKPLENALSTGFGGIGNWLFPSAGAASGLVPSSQVTPLLTGAVSSTGNVFSGGRRVAFAQCGLIDRSTTWMMSTGGMATAGEMDTEAIMPLRRLPNGNLGVQTSGGGGGGSQIHVNTPITIQNSGHGGKMDDRTIPAIRQQIDGAATVAVKRVIANE